MGEPCRSGGLSQKKFCICVIIAQKKFKQKKPRGLLHHTLPNLSLPAGSSKRGWLLLLPFVCALGAPQVPALVLDQQTFLEDRASYASKAKEADRGGGWEGKAEAAGADQGGGEKSPGGFTGLEHKLMPEGS